jgi:hypothetical protein
MIKLDEYTFEKRVNGTFEVRLHGEFVCHSKIQDEQVIDKKLQDMGFESRADFLNHRLNQYQ